jgi:hypothetical protein
VTAIAAASDRSKEKGRRGKIECVSFDDQVEIKMMENSSA